MSSDPLHHAMTKAVSDHDFKAYDNQSGDWICVCEETGPSPYSENGADWSPHLAHRMKAVNEVMERIREDQRQEDAVLHEIYRPEVVAEIAVELNDECSWEGVAKWCGGRIESAADHNGEWDSWIVLPNNEVAGNGSWIVLNHNGEFSVRFTVAHPNTSTLTQVKSEEWVKGHDHGYRSASSQIDPKSSLSANPYLEVSNDGE